MKRESASRSPLAVRGFHIDCRGPMLRFERIIEVLEDLARWGYNTVLFEYEDRFPFTGRHAGLCAPDALTRAQVKELNTRARSLGLTVMPLLHCLGHLEYVLSDDAYTSLREDAARGNRASTLCPSNPASRTLFRELATQVIDLHPDATLFHMGGDEAALSPGCPRCAEAAQGRGVSGMLVDHFLEVADWMRSQGPKPVIWCDMPLRHPEALGELAGRVVIMDWDYWSGTRPGHVPLLWLPSGLAAQGADRNDPDTWPARYRELFFNELFEADGKTTRPFPYTPFLIRHGFEVLVAPAARSSGGDSFCVPMSPHVDNVIGAARAAAAAGALGCVVTSWAYRRAPWPTTEHSIIAGGMAMNEPRVARRKIAAAFVAEHFGTDDSRLARLPVRLGGAVDHLTDSRPQFDPDTGQWWGERAAHRMARLAENRKRCQPQLRTLRAGLKRAEPLLQSMKPRTPRQERNALIWRWAHDVLALHATVGEWLLHPTRNRPTATERQAVAREIVRLERLSDELLGDWYTPHAMIAEQQTRFGELPRMLEATVTEAKRVRKAP